MQSLKKEFEYYISNQKEMVKEYGGKYIVIKKRQVVAVYGSREEAVQESMKKYDLGSFLVQYVETGKRNTSQTFHSRIIFHAN